MAQTSESSSQPSNVTSMRSSQEPMTPPPHCLHTDMAYFPSASPFEESCGLHETEGVKQSSVYPLGNFFGSPVHLVEFDSQVQLVSVQDRAETQRLRAPFVGMDRMMSASGDLQAAFRGGFFQSQHDVPSQSVETESFGNTQLLDQRYERYNAFGHVVFQPYTVSPNVGIPDGSSMSAATSKTWHSASVQIDSCIVPSDIDVDCQYEAYNMPVQTNQLGGLSPCGHAQTLNGEDAFRLVADGQQSDSRGESFQIKSEIDVSREKRSMYGQRGRKSGKERRSSKRAKRKFQHQLADEYISTLHGSDVGVRHVRQAEKQTKHICEHLDTNGKVCGQHFNRVEHLSRHVLIHSREKPYQCVLRDEKFNCARHFGRRDNLRDHYKTHLSSAKAGRNSRVEFDLLYQTLRQLEEADEAEKTIDILEKWRALGKHLKDQNVDRCGQ